MDLNHKNKILVKLESAIDDATNCARQIYYAKSCIEEGNTEAAKTLLGEALKYLGVSKPSDVGLSEYSLARTSRNELESIINDL